MRWMKHLTGAHADQDMQDLMAEFGAEGYGVYWLILEQIGSQLDHKKDDPSYRLTYKKWAETCSTSVQKFKKIINFLSDYGKVFIENNDIFLTIRCPKIREYRDEYTAKKAPMSGQF